MSGEDLDGRLGRRDFLRLAAKGVGAAALVAFAPTSAFAGNQHPDHSDHQRYQRYHENGYQHLEIGEDEIKGKTFVVKPEEKKRIGPAIHSREIKTAAGDQITEYTVGVEYMQTIKIFKPDTKGKSILDITVNPGTPSIWENTIGENTIVFYDSRGDKYVFGRSSGSGGIEYIDEGGAERRFSFIREKPGFNRMGYGRFRGNIEDIVLSKSLEDTQAKVIIHASEAELREYVYLQKKGIFPKTLKGFTFLDSAEAEKMKGNGTIESVGRYDFGVFGHLKLLKSDVDPVLFLMAQNHWLEMSKKAFVGKTLKAAERHGARYVRLITDQSPSDGIRYSGISTGKVQGGGHFLGWNIKGMFSGTMGSNSDYSLLGACELYKAK